MIRKMFTISILVIMFSLGGLKIFTRLLFLEGEAGAACIVATYMPALNSFLYERGDGSMYEAQYEEEIVLEERDGFVDPKQPIRFHIVRLAYFQDGSYGYPIYEWVFVRHLWHIEGYLLPFLFMGIVLILFEERRRKQKRN